MGKLEVDFQGFSASWGDTLKFPSRRKGGWTASSAFRLRKSPTDFPAVWGCLGRFKMEDMCEKCTLTLFLLLEKQNKSWVTWVKLVPKFHEKCQIATNIWTKKEMLSSDSDLSRSNQLEDAEILSIVASGICTSAQATRFEVFRDSLDPDLGSSSRSHKLIWIAANTETKRHPFFGLPFWGLLCWTQVVCEVVGLEIWPCWKLKNCIS